MQESEALGDLKKPIFDLDVEHLVRAQLLRKRTWKLILTSKNICQAGKDRLSGKCKTVPALLKRVLHCQDSWMPQPCKLAHTSLHHLPYQLSVTFLKPEKKCYHSLICYWSNLSSRARSRTNTEAACLVDFFTALYTWRQIWGNIGENFTFHKSPGPALAMWAVTSKSLKHVKCETFPLDI